MLVKTKTVSKGLYFNNCFFFIVCVVFLIFFLYGNVKNVLTLNNETYINDKKNLNYTSPSVIQKIHQEDNFVMGKKLENEMGGGG